MRLILVALVASLVASSCATDGTPGTSGSGGAVEPALVPALLVAPAAVRTVDAPGLNVEDLTARVRDAVARTSGVDAVDELSVRRELAACTEAPCPDEVAVRFRDAQFVVASTVSRVGSTFLASVRVQQGARELARANVEDPDARRALAKAGWAAGAALRRTLVESGVVEQVRAPGDGLGAGAGTERSDEGAANP